MKAQAAKVRHCELFFLRDELRRARDSTLANSEGYLPIVQAIERLGRQLFPCSKPLGLAGIRSDLSGLVRQYHPLEGEPLHEHELSFAQLFYRVREGRNDAVHVGAVARNLTSLSVKLAIILEETLIQMANLDSVKAYMVKEPVIAHGWQRLGLIRQTMLEHSFSYLPYRCDPGEHWQVISSDAIARYLRDASRTRRDLLKKSLRCALVDGLCGAQATTITHDTSLESAVRHFKNGSDFLIVLGGDGCIVGIATSFDLM